MTVPRLIRSPDLGEEDRRSRRPRGIHSPRGVEPALRGGAVGPTVYEVSGVLGTETILMDNGPFIKPKLGLIWGVNPIEMETFTWEGGMLSWNDF